MIHTYNISTEVLPEFVLEKYVDRLSYRLRIASKLSKEGEPVFPENVPAWETITLVEKRSKDAWQPGVTILQIIEMLLDIIKSSKLSSEDKHSACLKLQELFVIVDNVPNDCFSTLLELSDKSLGGV